MTVRGRWLSTATLFLYTVIVPLVLPLHLRWRLLRRRPWPFGAENFGRIRGTLPPSPPPSAPARRAEKTRRPVDDASERRRVWIHAVSVGEVHAAAALWRGLRSRYPNLDCVLTSATEAGLETARQTCPDAQRWMYSPLDVRPVVEQVTASVRPALFLLIETDIWPNLLRCLAQQNVPSVLLNGRISPRRLMLRPLFRPVLEQLSHFCMQTDLDVERLLKFGIDPSRISVTGNMKFAQAASLGRDAVPPCRADLGLPESVPVLFAGSTHPGEEEEIIRCYEALRTRYPDLALVIAPRHIDRAEQVLSLFRARGLPCARRSDLDGASPRQPIVVLDTIGELSSAYAQATVAFVGGSLVRAGGHNPLEPAAWGKPVLFGPHTQHYATIASGLENDGAAVRVRNGADLADRIDELLRDETRLADTGARAARFIANHQGAVERNLDIIDKLMSDRARPRW